MPKISIIIPCYYNEGNIPVTGPALIENERQFPDDVSFEYVFVNDGSKDNTLQELLKFKAQYPEKVTVINLAKNVGSNNASYCGIANMTGDCGVILAADLQDPPELIPQMMDHWRKGMKLVVAHRSDREDPWHQKMISNTYHNLMRTLAITNAPKGGVDLWLFDKQLAQEVVKMDDKNTYLPYLFLWTGFPYVAIPYVRRKREIGKSRWTFKKKIKSFIDSFVNFSFFPIRLISGTGLILGVVAVLLGVWLIIARTIGLIQIEGWTALMVLILFIGAFQIIALGIIGEYVWRVLDAARNRPNYIIDETWKAGDATKQQREDTLNKAPDKPETNHTAQTSE